jgi:HlyB family type I secretion system ABC transporter
MFRRYPAVRQNDGSDCGAAALATVALYHRRRVGLEQMRDLAGTDRIGTNLLGLAQAAERLGFSAKAVRGPYEAIAKVPLPAVAHVKTDEGLGHFVVLYRAGKRKVVVADPARGVRKLNRDEFEASWTGCLLLLTPNPMPNPMPATAQESSAPASPWRRFVGLVLCHRSVLAEALCCALLMTLLGISTSYFVQHLVDSVLVRGETRLLNALGIGMLLVVVFRTLFGLIRQYLLAHVARKVDLTLIAGYTRHVLALPMRFFEMRRVGEILARVNDAAKVREAISGATLTLVVDGVLVSLSLVVLWLYDAPLAAVATLFVPLLVGSVLVHHPAVKRRSHEAMENAAGLSAHLVEDISSVETVKAFGLERSRAEEGESRLVRFVQNIFSLQSLGMSMSSLGTLVTGAAGIVILWFGGHRVIDGALTIGQLMFFYTLLGYLLGPLERLASVNLQLQDALVAVDRLYQVMDIEAEASDAKARAKFNGIQQSIELRGVSFKYGCRANVLDNLSIRIPAGQTVAIVGESGCGKSTLLKLLMRFHDPTEGQILIDGVDARDLDLQSLRAGIGLVSQDPFIFNGTIQENITLAHPAATMREVIAAARAAGLEEFITQLPERYETVIGERGANLSGGQRQRLAIARALLRNPDLLIFDEATSHLDTATERAIQHSLKSALANKTVILVAHRLSTIRQADAIYVMDHGRVVEAGSHDELIQQHGRYAALWRAQFDGEPIAQVSPSVASHSRLNGHANLGALKHER